MTLDVSGEIESDDGDGRFLWTDFEPLAAKPAEGADVVAGLTAEPKTLPPKYFYDDHGSELFERICDQPEYYPTRTENAILATIAGEIAGLTGPCDMVELGSGSARKTRVLIDAYMARAGAANGSGALRYIPVDVSGGILKSSAQDLIGLHPDLEIWGLIGTYEQALEGLPPRDLPARMVMFLGSTMGNLLPDEAAAFLARAGQALHSGEYFLIGFDLQKPVEVLEAAYNDAAGVTAAFNLNMLRHLNTSYDGDFDLDRFEHLAFYNRDHNRIEMHLRSKQVQTATLRGLNLTVGFEDGETIHSEISRKFTRDYMADAFADAGFAPVKSWTDPREWYAVSLFRKN